MFEQVKEMKKFSLTNSPFKLVFNSMKWKRKKRNENTFNFIFNFSLSRLLTFTDQIFSKTNARSAIRPFVELFF